MSTQNQNLPNIPDKDVLGLKPFRHFCMYLGVIPSSYLEAMTNEELLLWFCDFLQNKVIPTVNNNAECVQELQELFTQLRTYVNDYFTNLDVQEEINNKLNQMAEDGSLTNLIKIYIDPLIAEQNTKINQLNSKVNNVVNGSPLVANSTSEMTDTSKVYVNTSDRKLVLL